MSPSTPYTRTTPKTGEGYETEGSIQDVHKGRVQVPGMPGVPEDVALRMCLLGGPGDLATTQ